MSENEQTDFVMKKRWGQNFLKNTKVIIDFVAALEMQKTDRILEIGPGLGALSEFIIENIEFTALIDIDPEAIAHLSDKFSDYPEGKLEIIHEDILKLDQSELKINKKINKIIGSLPYNISKRIIEKFCTSIDHEYQFAVFMLQKEVAFDYLGGKKGTYLFHYLNIFNEIELVREVEKSNFRPIPKVDSAIIRFVRRPELLIEKDDVEDYKKFIRNCFRNPRKKLSKNLRSIYRETDWMQIYKNLNMSENIRAQQLNNAAIIDLFYEFQAHKL